MDLSPRPPSLNLAHAGGRQISDPLSAWPRVSPSTTLKGMSELKRRTNLVKLLSVASCSMSTHVMWTTLKALLVVVNFCVEKHQAVDRGAGFRKSLPHFLQSLSQKFDLTQEPAFILQISAGNGASGKRSPQREQLAENCTHSEFSICIIRPERHNPLCGTANRCSDPYLLRRKITPSECRTRESKQS